MSAHAAPRTITKRATIDRSAAERDVPGLLDALLADPAAVVVAVRGDAVPTDEHGALRLLEVTDLDDDTRWAFLGRAADGAPVLLGAVGEDALPDLRWAPLRIAGATLGEDAADRAVEAVSLARWLHDAPFCPACGAQTALEQAGWSRRCPACGRQHFPRTDPAVIVAVTDPDGERLLLGANAAWGQARFSCFAGFAEAGESLEGAVEREVAEEAGVRLRDITYRGSQPWPYPRSLMLGFRAVAADVAQAQADGEEIVEVRWFDRAQIRLALAGEGEVTLPGPASIAHRLIVDWLEERA
ncbi:NAD(+) diphosphatase [Microbacterium sp. GXF7504]